MTREPAENRPLPLVTAFVRSRPLVLLLALLVSIVATPLLPFEWMQTAAHIAVILASLNMAADNRRHLRVGLALAVPATILLILGDIESTPVLDLWAYPLILGLYLFIIGLMLRRIFQAEVVTLDTIGTALCAYVLLGVLWVLFYVPVVLFDPDAFVFANLPDGIRPNSLLTYFSFVTLTTLGYGDVAPVSPLARGLAITEAITGVLFLAVLISRLVGAYGGQRRS